MDLAGLGRLTCDRDAMDGHVRSLLTGAGARGTGPADPGVRARQAFGESADRHVRLGCSAVDGRALFL